MKAFYHDQPNPAEGARLCFVVLTREGDESGFVPSHPRSDAGPIRAWSVVKATDSYSSLSDSLTDSGTEGIRICFVWLAYEGDESGFVAAAPKADEGDESGFVAAAPKADEPKDTNWAPTAGHRSELPGPTSLSPPPL